MDGGKVGRVFSKVVVDQSQGVIAAESIEASIRVPLKELSAEGIPPAPATRMLLAT